MKAQYNRVKKLAQQLRDASVENVILKTETPADAKPVLVAGLSPKPKKLPWNWGKRKPEPDQDGDLWCSCLKPKLVSNAGGRGQAYCLLCGTPYYH